MAAYGRITHQLMQARQLLEEADPRSDREQRELTEARLRLDTVLLLVRRLRHRARHWRD